MTRTATQPLHPVGPVRRHVRQLHNKHQMTYRQIARLAHVGVGTIRCIAAAPGCRAVRHVMPSTAAALLAVTPRRGGRADRIDATGSQRRLQALTAIGWPDRALAAHLGLAPQRIQQFLHQGDITPTSAARIRRLYDTLSMTPYAGKYASRARNKACRLGWASPLAWPDDTIDDPVAKPVLDAAGVTRYDHAKVVLALAGMLPYDQLSHAEGEKVIRRLNANGLNDYEIAEKLHADPDTIGRRRMRLGLPHRFDPCGRMGKAAS
jgi:hypothetical protein